MHQGLSWFSCHYDSLHQVLTIQLDFSFFFNRKNWDTFTDCPVSSKPIYLTQSLSYCLTPWSLQSLVRLTQDQVQLLLDDLYINEDRHQFSYWIFHSCFFLQNFVTKRYKRSTEFVFNLYQWISHNNLVVHLSVCEIIVFFSQEFFFSSLIDYE